MLRFISHHNLHQPQLLCSVNQGMSTRHWSPEIEAFPWFKCTGQAVKYSREANQPQAKFFAAIIRFISVSQYFAVQMYFSFRQKCFHVLGPGFFCVLLAADSSVHALSFRKTQSCPWMDAPQLLCQLPASSSATSLRTAESFDYSTPPSLQVALL